MQIILILLGAMLTVGGLLHLVKQAISRAPMSGPARRQSSGEPTIEPRLPRTGLFQLSGYWPGFVMIALGIVYYLQESPYKISVGDEG